MTYDFLSRISKTVQIFGIFVLLACFSSQSLAEYGYPFGGCSDLGTVTNTIEITQSTNEIISHYFTVNTSNLDDEDVVATILNSGDFSILESLVADKTVTLSNGKQFVLGGSSQEFELNGNSLGFTLQFSKANIINWLGTTSRRSISFRAQLSEEDDSRDDDEYECGYSDVTITFKINEHAYIDGLDDIELPQTDDMHFCVSSTSQKVRLAFATTNLPGSFQLKAGDSENSHVIDYAIELTGEQNGVETPITLDEPGAKDEIWDANQASFSHTNCQGDENMSLLIKMDKQQEIDAPPGSYKDTITITVSPAL